MSVAVAAPPSPFRRINIDFYTVLLVVAAAMISLTTVVIEGDNIKITILPDSRSSAQTDVVVRQIGAGP